MDTEHAGQCNDCTRFRLFGAHWCTLDFMFRFSTTDVFHNDYKLKVNQMNYTFCKLIILITLLDAV